MRYYCYILCDSSCGNFQVGACADIVKAMKLFEKHDELRIVADKRMHILIYLEVYPSKDEAIKRMAEIFILPKAEKEALIETANKDWIPLIPGTNITL